ncbi:hypothetical protein ACHAXN_011902 [Cyclotella atomus]
MIISTISTLPTTLYTTIFNPTPTQHDLLLLISSISLFWYITFRILHTFLHPFALRQKWLHAAFAREYDRVGHSMCNALNVQWSKERYIQIFLNDWPKMQGIYLQHFIGGALALPAVLNHSSIINFDNDTAASLACLGILSEMGWELSDLVDIFVTRTTMSDGKERIPNSLVIIFAIHHSMALTLGIPMVLKYRYLREMHLLTFNLQWAAAIAIGVNEITKCLDLKNPSQLWGFRVMNGLCFLIMAWMRGVMWIQLSWRMIWIWVEDEEWACLGVGLVVCALITGFNFALCIYPFYKKMVKFSVWKEVVGGMGKREESQETLDTEVSSLLEDDEEEDELLEGEVSENIANDVVNDDR